MKVLLSPDAPAGSDPILDILKQSKTIAVVGLSSSPLRASHSVAEYLQNAGYRLVGVNPGETEVLGIKCFARLEDIPERVDIVDIFRRVQEIPAVVDSAIAIGAKVAWMQLGLEEPESAKRAAAAGLTVEMDACTLIEHRLRKSQLRS